MKSLFAKILKKITRITAILKCKEQIITLVADDIFSAVSEAGSVIIREGEKEIAYWTGTGYVTPSRDEHRTFLKEAAARAGIDKDTASSKRFIDSLDAQIKDMPDKFFDVDRDTKYDLLIINFKNMCVRIDPWGQMMAWELSQEMLPTVNLPFEYDPDAQCPLFMQYLCSSLPDAETRTALLEYFGVCHIPFGHAMEPNLQKCAVLIGPRDSGKTVFTNILDEYFGHQAVVHRQLATITQPDTFLRGDMENKLLCISNDVDNRITNKEIFKSLVTGEPLEADRKHKEAIELRHYAHLLIVGNSYSQVFCDDPAFFKRILPIPFRNSIPPERQDHDLSKKIIEKELPGIANLVLSRLVQLLQRHNKDFTFSQEMREDLDAYQNNAFHVNEFLQTAGYEENRSTPTRQSQLYAEYCSYCSEHRYTDRLTSTHSFGNALKNLGCIMKIIDNQNFFLLAKNE